METQQITALVKLLKENGYSCRDIAANNTGGIKTGKSCIRRGEVRMTIYKDAELEQDVVGDLPNVPSEATAIVRDAEVEAAATGPAMATCHK